MSNMNLTESTSIVEEAQNFQIEFEPINLTPLENAAQNDNNADEFKNIQDDIDEYSIEIQEEISRTNKYLKTRLLFYQMLKLNRNPIYQKSFLMSQVNMKIIFSQLMISQLNLGLMKLPDFRVQAIKIILLSE